MLITPLIKAFKNKYPNSKLALLTDSKYTSLFKEQHFITKVYNDDPLSKHYYKNIAHEIDIFVDVHLLKLNTSYENIIKELRKRSKNVFGLSNSKKELNFLEGTLDTNNMHFSDYVFTFLDNYKLERSKYDYLLNIKPTTYEQGKNFLNKEIDYYKKTIGIFPGASVDYKRWPLSYYNYVIKKLKKNFNIIIFLGPSEKSFFNNFKDEIVFQDLELMDFVSILLQINLLITNDTGPKHLAASINIPTISLHGHSDPLIWGPLGEKKINIISKVACSPCGLEYCKQESVYCMQEIKPDEVIKKVTFLLGGN